MKTDPCLQILLYQHVLHRDASGTGVFFGKIRKSLETLLSKPFTKVEASRSSTFIEIRVFWKFYMKTDLTPYKNSSILHFTYSKATKHIITYGSRNEDLQQIVYNIEIKTVLFGISLAAR